MQPSKNGLDLQSHTLLQVFFNPVDASYATLPLPTRMMRNVPNLHPELAHYPEGQCDAKKETERHTLFTCLAQPVGTASAKY